MTSEIPPPIALNRLPFSSWQPLAIRFGFGQVGAQPLGF